MLGALLFGTSSGELLSKEGERLLIRSDRLHKEGAEVNFRLRLPDGRNHALKLAVESCRVVEGASYLVTGFAVSGADALEVAAAEPFRENPRLDCHICVVSRDLPGYRAVTVDYSRGGVQIEVSGAVEPGASVLVRLEFGVDALPPLECRARVAWCAQRTRGSYRVGLQFVSLDARSQDILERFESILKKREHTSILHRLLFGDDHGQEPIPAHARKPAPPVQAITGTLHEGVVARYAMEPDALVLELSRPGGETAEYRFESPRGLSDHGATTGDNEIGDLVEKPCAGSRRRFAFVDRFGNPVLEVVAASYTRS